MLKIINALQSNKCVNFEYNVNFYYFNLILVTPTFKNIAIFDHF